MVQSLGERFVRRSSRIHRLDPRTKLIATLLFILTTTTLPFGDWLSYTLLFMATLLVASQTQLGLSFALRRSLIALPFALAAITLPFTVRGTPLFEVGPLTVSLEGTVRFVSILIKSWLAVQMAILMTATTAVPDLLWSMRALGLPRPLVSIIGLMYRYLFVLTEEAARLMRARASRSALGPNQRSGVPLRQQARIAGGMVGNLSLRAFERSERVYAAMTARGFTGEMQLLDHPTMTQLDLNVLVGWTTFLAMTLLIGLVF